MNAPGYAAYLWRDTMRPIARSNREIGELLAEFFAR